MNSFPRRSPRFQQQSQSTPSAIDSLSSFGPSSSQTSSTTSTSHPSPTSDNLILNQAQQYTLKLQSQYLAPADVFNAPLPSPSANNIDPFGRIQHSHYTMGGQTQNKSSTSSHQSNNQQTQSHSQHQHHQEHHNSFSQPQRPNFPPTSVDGVPPGLPADFLAEAAKRAQMACLMRDLDEVSL